MKKNDNSAPSVDMDYLDPPRLRCMFTRKKISLPEKQMIPVDNVNDEEVFKGIELSGVIEEDYQEEAPEMQEEVLEIEKETHRLAVVNMNWKNAKAADLYALFYSLVAPNGLIKIKSVAIYPTLFGLQRIKEIKQEEQQEEQEIRRRQVQHEQYMDDLDKCIKAWLIDRYGEDKFNLCQEKTCPIVQFDDDDDDDDPWESWPNILYDNDEKSRYFFAVVECDSCATTLQIYKQNDGAVFEFDGSNPLDLRFIPDHMDFKHPPQDVATIKSLTPSLISYWELLLADDVEGTYGDDDDDDDDGTNDDEGTDTHLKLFLPF